MWIACAVGHLLGAVELAAGQYLAASAAFLAAQVAFGLALLYKTHQALYLHDIRVVFIGAYALYGLANPFAVLYFGYPETRAVTEAVALYALGLMGFNLAQAIMPTRCVCCATLAKPRRLASIVVPLSLLALFCVILVLAVKLDKRITFGQIIGARQHAGEVDQSWVVANYSMQGLAFCGIAYFARLSGWAKAATAGVILAWAMVHFGLGNRREFVPVILFGLAYVCLTRGIKLRLVHVGFALVGITAMMLVGVVRSELPKDLSFREMVLLAARSNEFVYPIETTAFYVSLPDYQFKLGTTYLLRLPQYIIPRALWPAKPVSLGTQFVIDMVGTTRWQGYAYSPVTEAYINFGWAGPFCMMYVFGILANMLLLYGRRNPIVYLTVTASVVDFVRGEFGGWAYQTLVVLAGLELPRLLSSAYVVGNRERSARRA